MECNYPPYSRDNIEPAVYLAFTFSLRIGRVASGVKFRLLYFLLPLFCSLPNACDRRLLHSAAFSPVLNTVRGVATELFFCDVDEVFPPGSHLCRVCV